MAGSADRRAVDADLVHRWLRSRRRHARPDVLYRLYLVALGTVPLTYAAWQGPGEGPVLDAAAVLEPAATWAPVALLLVLIAVARYASWAGVAIPERGAVAWVLTAPIRRADLLGPPLRRALLTWLATGALIGHLLVLEVVARLEAPTIGLALAAIGGGAAVGAIAVGLSWWVQATPRIARVAVRLSPWAAMVAVAAGAAADAAEPARAALLRSGPWGWAVAPVLEAAGHPVPGWRTAATALGATAVAAVVRTLWKVDAVPTSELARRADPVSGVRAATYAGDLRFAAELRRRAHRDLVGPSSRRVPRPRRAGLAVPWLGAMLLLRSPRWLLSAALAGVAVPVAARADVVARSSAPTIVVVLLTVGACATVCSQVLDPLRAEETTGFAWRHLPRPPRAVTLQHLIAPAVAAWIAIGVAASVAAMAGATGELITAAAGASLLSTVALVPAAALSVTAPPPDPGELTGPGAGLAVARRALGTPLGVAVVALVATGGALATDAGADTGSVLLGSVVPTAVAGGGFTLGLVRRLSVRDR